MVGFGSRKIHKIILEHIIVTDSKELLTKQNKKPALMEFCQTDTRQQYNLKSSEWPKLEQFEPQNK